MINRTCRISSNIRTIQCSNLRQTINNLLYQVSSILHRLELSSIKSHSSSIAQGHAIFEKCNQMVEPERHRFPPLLSFAYTITFANPMRATRMLAYQIHAIFSADPVSRIKETIPPAHQYKCIRALRL